MAEQALEALYQRIQRLKEGGSGDGVDQQAEIFRLCGLIEWIIKLEGGTFLENMEDRHLSVRVKKQLQEAKEQAEQALIGNRMLPLANVEEDTTEHFTEFPEYWELPDLPRVHILSFLDPNDLLSLARAFPSEAQLFKLPLGCLELNAVYPLLIQKRLISPEDVLKLSGAHPFFAKMTVEHFESNLSEDMYGYYLAAFKGGVPLDVLAKDKGHHPVSSHCKLMLRSNADFEGIVDNLTTCGHRVLDCCLLLIVSEDLNPDHFVHCLQLMPNLQMLSVFTADEDEEDGFPITPEQLPELPFLQLMRISNFVATNMALQRSLLRKYSGKCKMLVVHSFGDSEPGFRISTDEGAALSTLQVATEPYLFIPAHRFLGTLSCFVNCPIKILDLRLGSIMLRSLITFIGLHWGNTLEELCLMSPADDSPTFFDAEDQEPNAQQDEGSTWMLNLRFSKMRCFETDCYPLEKCWAFLLLFPELEELCFARVRLPAILPDEDEEEVGEMELQGQGNPEEVEPRNEEHNLELGVGDNGDAVEGNQEALQENEEVLEVDGEALEQPPEHDDDTFILDPSTNKFLMFKNNIWKIFPKLEKVSWNEKEVLTRQDCVKCESCSDLKAICKVLGLDYEDTRSAYLSALL